MSNSFQGGSSVCRFLLHLCTWLKSLISKTLPSPCCLGVNYYRFIFKLQTLGPPFNEFDTPALMAQSSIYLYEQPIQSCDEECLQGFQTHSMEGLVSVSLGFSFQLVCTQAAQFSLIGILTNRISSEKYLLWLVKRPISGKVSELGCLTELSQNSLSCKWMCLGFWLWFSRSKWCYW